MTNSFATYFNGTTSYAMIPHNDMLNIVNNITIEAWIKKESAINPRILQKGVGNTAFSLMFEANSNAPSVRLFLGTDMIFTSSKSVPLNVWTHVAVTFNGSQVIFYINGVKANTVNAVGKLGTNLEDLYIGKRGDSLDSTYFKGGIDEVRIWNVTRTPEQIAEFMNKRVGAYTEGLVGYWSFEESTGNTIYDLSQNGFNGTMHNVSRIPSGVEVTSDKYMFIKQNDSIYYYDSTWKLLNEELSMEVFTEKGLISIGEEINEFENTYGKQYQIIYWSSNPLIEAKLKAYPDSQVVYPIRDVSLFGVDEIERVELIGIGDIKVAISFDSGVTWLSYVNNTWTTIVNASEGMNSNTFNSLTKEQLMEGKGENKTIRFSYYISNNGVIDNVKMMVNMSGKEGVADYSTHQMSYDAISKKITFNINKSGYYNINYMDVEA